jgi:hypothetical protein
MSGLASPDARLVAGLGSASDVARLAAGLHPSVFSCFMYQGDRRVLYID